MLLLYSGYMAGALLVLLIIIKTIHFITNKNSNWKSYHWFYFSRANIIGSTSDRRRVIKNIQNRYSILILILLIVTLLLLRMSA